MLYIRFLNLQNPLQDVEQLYKDGTIEQGDIVCQQYTDKYSRLFMNGTWVKTKYISKIAQNTEVEDDVKTLYDSIVNTSTMLNDTSIRLNNVSTRLNNLYTNTQIDTFISNLNTSINNVSNNVKTVSDKLTEVSTRLDNSSTRLNNVSINIGNVSTRLNDTSTRLNDTSVRLLNYLTINQYLKDEELIASTFADVNNKINSLYAEIAELKEQLKSSTK